MKRPDADIEELLSRAVAREPLSDEEQRRLQDAVRADPEVLRELVDDACLDGLLRTAGRLSREPEPFAARVWKRVELEKDAARFAAATRDRLLAAGAPAPPPWRRWRWALTAVFATAVAGAAALVLILRAPGPGRGGGVDADTPRIVRVQGPARLVRDGASRPLAAGADLGPGDRIEADDGGAVVVALAGSSRLDLAGPGALTREPPAAERHEWRIEQGTLQARIAPQPLGRVLSFATPHARASVLGTAFVLAVGEEETRLDVTEGRVLFELLPDGGVREIAAGGFAVARRGQALLAADAAGAAPPARPGETAAPQPLERFDFEDGQTPSLFANGQVVDCPEAARSPRCLIGTVRLDWPEEYTIRLLDPEVYRDRGRRARWRYADDLVVSFAYWNSSRSLRVKFFNPERQQNYELRLRNVPTRRWSRAVVRLRDAAGINRPAEPSQEGDRIQSFVILGGRIPGQPLYVDDLVIERARPLPPESRADAPLQ